MFAIGIDVGGTSVKGGLIDSDGKIYKNFSFVINKKIKPDEVVEDIADIVKQYQEIPQFKRKIKGIGLGIPGAIDSRNGVITSSANLPLWEGYNIVDKLQNATNLPVRINNDANVAALAETKFGAGKNADISVLITLGTGVGSGIVINGKIFEGNEGKGGEIGHTTLIMGGRKCSCGRHGCFETYASATGLIKDTNDMIKAHPETKMKDVAIQQGGVNAKVAFIASRHYDDKWANKVVDNYIMYLGEGLLNICNFLRPNVIILSGGVANEGSYLIKRLKNYLKSQNYGYKNCPIVEVVQGVLGYDSGKIGAAALFFE